VDSADAFGTDPQVLTDISALEEALAQGSATIAAMMTRVQALETLLGVAPPDAGKMDFSQSSQSGLVGTIS